MAIEGNYPDTDKSEETDIVYYDPNDPDNSTYCGYCFELLTKCTCNGN